MIEEGIHYKCNTCLYFHYNEDIGIYHCEKGNIYPSENKSPICIDCECYTRKENEMINANDLYYDDNEAIKFIKEETNLDESTIKKVLASEFRYMQSVGIIEEGIDYD